MNENPDFDPEQAMYPQCGYHSLRSACPGGGSKDSPY